MKKNIVTQNELLLKRKSISKFVKENIIKVWYHENTFIMHNNICHCLSQREHNKYFSSPFSNGNSPRRPGVSRLQTRGFRRLVETKNGGDDCVKCGKVFSRKVALPLVTSSRFSAHRAARRRGQKRDITFVDGPRILARVSRRFYDGLRC